MFIRENKEGLLGDEDTTQAKGLGSSESIKLCFSNFIFSFFMADMFIEV